MTPGLGCPRNMVFHLTTGFKLPSVWHWEATCKFIKVKVAKREIRAKADELHNVKLWVGL